MLVLWLLCFVQLFFYVTSTTIVKYYELVSHMQVPESLRLAKFYFTTRTLGCPADMAQSPTGLRIGKEHKDVIPKYLKAKKKYSVDDKLFMRLHKGKRLVCSVSCEHAVSVVLYREGQISQKMKFAKNVISKMDFVNGVTPMVFGFTEEAKGSFIVQDGDYVLISIGISFTDNDLLDFNFQEETFEKLLRDKADKMEAVEGIQNMIIKISLMEDSLENSFYDTNSLNELLVYQTWLNQPISTMLFQPMKLADLTVYDLVFVHRSHHISHGMALKVYGFYYSLTLTNHGVRLSDRSLLANHMDNKGTLDTGLQNGNTINVNISRCGLLKVIINGWVPVGVRIIRNDKIVKTKHYKSAEPITIHDKMPFQLQRYDMIEFVPWDHLDDHATTRILRLYVMGSDVSRDGIIWHDDMDTFDQWLV